MKTSNKSPKTPPITGTTGEIHSVMLWEGVSGGTACGLRVVLAWGADAPPISSTIDSNRPIHEARTERRERILWDILPEYWVTSMATVRAALKTLPRWRSRRALTGLTITVRIEATAIGRNTALAT